MSFRSTGLFPCWGQRWALECPVHPVSPRVREIWSQGHPDKLQKAEGDFPPYPRPGPLTFSFCLVTRHRRELSLRFTLALLSLLSIFPALSSLLRGRKFGEEGAADPEGPSEPVLQVASGIHLESVSLRPLHPVSPLLWSLTLSLLLSLTHSLNKHLQRFANFRNHGDQVCRGEGDMVSNLRSLDGPCPSQPPPSDSCPLPISSA